MKIKILRKLNNDISTNDIETLNRIKKIKYISHNDKREN